MQHVLEMVVQMQTGAVNTGLNGIENKILQMTDNLVNFNKTAAEGNTDKMAMGYAKIQEALRTSNKLTGLMTSSNYENMTTNMKSLKAAVLASEGAMATKEAIEGAAIAQARLNTMTDYQVKFYSNTNKLITKNQKLVDKIMKDKIVFGKLSKQEVKDVREISRNIKAMVKNGDPLVGQFEEIADSMEKMDEFSDRSSKNIVTLSDAMKKTGGFLSQMIPGLGQFAGLVTPFALLGDQLKMVNEVYEQNHTVNNMFLADSEAGINVTEALATAHLDATNSGVLLSESQSAMNAILQAGVPIMIKSSDQLAKMTTELAINARATGISEAVLADLMLRTKAYGDSIGRTTKLTDTFVNVMAKNRLTTSQMSKITNILQKDLYRLDKAYKVLGKDGKQVATGAEGITSMMGGIAAAARDAGQDADAAMSLMAKAIEQPLSVAALLGSSLTSNSFGEQMLTMGANAEKFAAQMNKMPPALQGVFAQKLGVTPAELNSQAEGTKKYRVEAAKLAKTLNKGSEADNLKAAKGIIAARITRENTDATAAAEITAKANANATRELSAAWDQIRVAFGKVAVIMQPVLEIVAKMLTAIVDSSWAKYTLIIAGGFLAIVGPLKLFGKVFGKVSNEVAKATSKSGGGMLEGLGKGIKGFMNQIASIEAKKALMGALAIAAVGVALAVGIVALGLSIRLMPPDKIALLGMMVGGLLVAMVVMAKIGPSAAKALPGALALAAVGAALAAGIALLGLSIRLMPPDKIALLGMMVGGLLAATLIMGLIGPLAVPALMGALALLAVGAALSGAIALLGLAIGLMPPDKVALLGMMVGGLLAATLIMGLIGPLAIPALMGAVGLLAVGAALAGAISLLGLAIRLMPASKIKLLGMVVGGLLVATGLAAAIGAVIPLALAGAVGLIAVAGALAIGIVILSSVSGQIVTVADGIEVLIGALSKLDPKMGESLILVGAGLAAFGAALVGGAIAEFFGADMVGQALIMADAMAILEPSIASIAAMGPGAASAFKMIGEGMVAMSEALSGGGMFDFFSGDTIKNAIDLAAAMEIVISPISKIGAMGDATSKAFINMAFGLKQFMAIFKEDAGWFDSFENNASDIAAALDKISAPMARLAGIQKAGSQSNAQIDEIKTALALTIDANNETNEAILEKLEEINIGIQELGDSGLGGGGGTSAEVTDELRKSTALLERIFGEMSMGSSFGGTMADTRYNV